MYIIVKELVTDQTEKINAALYDAYHDYHTTTTLYIESINRKGYASVTEYQHNAKQFKTIEAAKKAMNAKTYKAGETVNSAGYIIREI